MNIYVTRIRESIAALRDSRDPGAALDAIDAIEASVDELESAYGAEEFVAKMYVPRDGTSRYSASTPEGLGQEVVSRDPLWTRVPREYVSVVMRRSPTDDEYRRVCDAFEKAAGALAKREAEFAARRRLRELSKEFEERKAMLNKTGSADYQARIAALRAELGEPNGDST